MRDISLHLLDIIQNSVSANANKISIKIETCNNAEELEIEVADNGSGMDMELLKQVTSPFVTTRTTRRIGLGISLFKASAELTGGRLEIESEKGRGTTLKVFYKINSIDRPPIGSIAETITSTIIAHEDIEINLEFKSCIDNFRFSTSEVRKQIGEVPINNFGVIQWIREFIDEGIKITFGGVLNEVNS